MSETKLKGAPISPVPPPQNSTPTSPTPAKVRTRDLLPYLGNDEVAGIPPGQRVKAEKLLWKFRETDATDHLASFLSDATVAQVEAIAQVETVTRQPCGAIERRMLQDGAIQRAIGRFFIETGMGHKEKASREALSLVHRGSSLLDSAGRNTLNAYDLAVRIARTAPAVPKDVLAEWTKPSEPTKDEEPTDD